MAGYLLEGGQECLEVSTKHPAATSEHQGQPKKKNICGKLASEAGK